MVENTVSKETVSTEKLNLSLELVDILSSVHEQVSIAVKNSVKASIQWFRFI